VQDGKKTTDINSKKIFLNKTGDYVRFKFRLTVMLLLSILLSISLALAAGGGGGGGGGGSSVSPQVSAKCNSVEISISTCMNDESGFNAEFEVQNAEEDDLKLEFVTLGGRTLKYEKNAKSSFLQNLVLGSTGSAFTVEVDNLEKIKTFQVSLPECVGSNYIYSKMECSENENEEPQQEDKGEELKCGGYLGIEDRVRCRINLREEQADEYENFFPEECRSWEDKGKCVSLYRAVQTCWEQGSSVSRIACLRGKVGLENVASQRSQCQGDQQCLNDLKEDVYTLIKLRLYNLEEEAEELYEEGIISEDTLVDFVVKMEKSKLAFNEAQSKEERRNVILQARQYWLELTRERLK